MSDERLERLRSRREPPPLVPVTVVDRAEVTPRLLRLTFGGPGIHEMTADPAASVRLLVPSPGTDELVLPTWNGNEFLLPGEVRPALRTFTPLAASADDHLALEIVRHPGGAVSSWAETARPGDPAAISGPGRGADIPDDVEIVHLLGDETAVPAIGQLLTVLPARATVTVDAEVVDAAAIRDLPERLDTTIQWRVLPADTSPGTTLVDAARALPEITPSGHVWAAGEAASMQAVRRHLFEDRGLPRGQTTVRGYWKPARDPS